MNQLVIVMLWVACVMSAGWFLLLTFSALLMATPFADEPGDTNGLRRFLMLFAIGLPGLIGRLIAARAIRQRNSMPAASGFPVISSPPADPPAQKRPDGSAVHTDDGT